MSEENQNPDQPAPDAAPVPLTRDELVKAEIVRRQRISPYLRREQLEAAAEAQIANDESEAAKKAAAEEAALEEATRPDPKKKK